MRPSTKASSYHFKNKIIVPQQARDYKFTITINNRKILINYAYNLNFFH